MKLGDVDRRAHLAAGVDDLLEIERDLVRFVARAAVIERAVVAAGAFDAERVEERRQVRALLIATLEQTVILLIEAAVQRQPRQRLRAHLDDLPAGAFDLLELLEDFRVLAQRDLDGAIQREIAGDGADRRRLAFGGDAPRRKHGEERRRGSPAGGVGSFRLAVAENLLVDLHPGSSAHRHRAETSS